MMVAAIALILVVGGCQKRAQPNDSFPTAQEVQSRLRPGMTREEVIAAFGEPLREMPEENSVSEMIYMSPAFYSPGPRPRGYIGFQVYLTNGKVIRWSPMEGEIRR